MHPFGHGQSSQGTQGCFGIGYCNITKCCTEVCPEHIRITDNAIIPLKERIADAFYDPLAWIWRAIFATKDRPETHAS
jgi:succinate dehydrogenase / fumarate reductase iron-sulfur subunit